MEKLIESIKSCDFSYHSLSKVQEALLSAKAKLPVVEFKIQKGQAVYRCRKMTKTSNIFYFESDISYRKDIANITSFGRANLPNQSVFYGSLTSEEINDGILPSIRETSAMFIEPEDEVLHEGYESYTVGMWIAKEDTYVNVIPPAGQYKKPSKLNDDIDRAFENGKYQSNTSDEIKEFYSLIGHEMCKDVLPGAHLQYGISAIFSSFLLSQRTGIAYPSVKTDQKVLNVAFTPQKFDELFIFQRAGIVDVFKFGKDAMVRHLWVAESKNGYPLKYEDVPSESFVPLETVVQYFKNKGFNDTALIGKILDYYNRA
jgi:hypothetical protein